MVNDWKNIGEIVKSESDLCPSSFTWTIKNFHSIYTKIGDWLESPKFSTNQYEWNLELYTAGYDESSSDYFGIQAYLHNKHKYPNARFEVEFWNLNEKGIKQASNTIVLDHKTLNEHAGTIKCFILRDDLLSELKLLPNDELKIVCRISTDINEGLTDVISQKHKLGILEKLYYKQKFSDFKFIVGDKEYNVHRAIVAAASPVFEAMLESNMRESSEGKVIIGDIEPKVMESLLHFIYVGRVDDFEDFSDKLLEAAEKYQLDALKSLCENQIAEDLDLDNVYDVLMLADKFNACTLKKMAMGFFSENVELLNAKAGFKTSIGSLQGNLQVDIICCLADKLSNLK